jgi:hypothetical protein
VRRLDEAPLRHMLSRAGGKRSGVGDRERVVRVPAIAKELALVREESAVGPYFIESKASLEAFGLLGEAGCAVL